MSSSFLVFVSSQECQTQFIFTSLLIEEVCGPWIAEGGCCSEFCDEIRFPLSSSIQYEYEYCGNMAAPGPSNTARRHHATGRHNANHPKWNNSQSNHIQRVPEQFQFPITRCINSSSWLSVCLCCWLE